MPKGQSGPAAKTADKTAAESADNAGDKAQPGSAGNAKVLLVTGMSGAGKSTALKALEDMGYEAVDNLPISLLASLVRPLADGDRPLAIGVDIRTRDFGVESFLEQIDRLIAEQSTDVGLLFLDCEDEVLRRRYTETRRRHPLAADRPLMDGIKHERQLVAGLRDRADFAIDTSELLHADLQRLLRTHYGAETQTGLTVFVTSFSFRRGLPREADLVLDVRFLANPHYDPALRPLTGCDEGVARFVAKDPDYRAFFDSLTAMLETLLPRYGHEGKSYLTIAIGCTGGRHRSVFVAEELANWLRKRGGRVEVSHRDFPLPDA